MWVESLLIVQFSKFNQALKKVIAKTSELWLYLINSCLAKQSSLMDLSVITPMDFVGSDCCGFSSLWDVKKLQLDEAFVKHNDSFVWYCFGSTQVLKVTIQHVLSLVLQRHSDLLMILVYLLHVIHRHLLNSCFCTRSTVVSSKCCIITTFILCSCRLVQFTIYLPGILQFCSNQPEQLS